MEKNLYNYLCSACAFAPASNEKECSVSPKITNPVFDHFNSTISDAESVYGGLYKFCANNPVVSDINQECNCPDELNDFEL